MVDPDDEGRISANPGYPLGQLEHALVAAEGDGDPEVRARAARRVEQWKSVLAGMLDGSIRVGSRIPVPNVPAWVTLEVVQGGFATGGLLAGGPLQPHEKALLAEIGEPERGDDRTALNLWHLGDTGRRRLLEMMANGRYRVHVPEEGALLVVAWLIDQGEPERAAALLDAITPAFDRLRFFPVPDPEPFVASSVVKLQTIGQTMAQLERARPSSAIARMNEALSVWAPLADRMVSLLLETIEGPVPRLRTAEDGTLVRRPDGQPEVEGGWPLRRLPPELRRHARALVEEAERLRRAHRLCRKPDRPRENLPRLREYLQHIADDPARLGPRDLGMLRRVLASYVTRHGVPGSEAHLSLRSEQARIAALPTHAKLRAALVDRLRELPVEGGIADVDRLMAPLAEHEARRVAAPTRTPLPDHLAAKVARCLEATIDELVRREVIGSSEVLARVLPQMTSQIRAAGIADPELRRLYATVYAAFRRRRSLLLIDLDHQVRLEELPWIAMIDTFREPDMGEKATARQALEQIAALAVTGFPQTILPNKLVQELGALASSADLSLPLTDELAADIFMGTFTPKFVESARVAARVLGGTLYERYYGVPFERVLSIDDFQKRAHHAARSSPAFADLCTDLARPGRDDRWSVARNGKIIEQQQILTTHNLAVLFDSLGLWRLLDDDLPLLAQRCFRWICRRQQMKHHHWRSELRAVKDSAYAWRQMLFFLSLGDAVELERFLVFAREHAASKLAEEVRRRLAPALDGLVHVASGGRFDDEGRAPGGARRFLGWSTERHWLMRPRPAH